MTDAIALILIFAVVIVVLLVIIWSQAKDNAQLQAQAGYDEETIRFLKAELETASKNDHRDPRTGRYAK